MVQQLLKRIACLCLAYFAGSALYSQTIHVEGHIQDTLEKKPLAHAVVVVSKLKDSSLVTYTRTNAEGRFELKALPIDTYQVVISHPRFSDQSIFIFGNKENLDYELGKIILPAKGHDLSEVVILAYKDPVYYKGDTLVYTADSFKTRANATVEDLLKKLPGIKVDAQGKITSQGKAVDQVLVDGDEFFGTDPTVATRNLNANNIESVQVYDKKKEDATSDKGEETVKIMNLKLKEDAKKGYFGKASGASDFQRFYEGELLANKFKDKQKISVFGLASNTPKSSFGWNDVFKYGLDNEMNTGTNDNGDTYYYSDNNNQNTGIPQTLKTGFYFSDKLFKNTKINFNYSFTNNQLKTHSETKSQYYLADTSYITNNSSTALQKNQGHAVNFNITQPIDSLTELQVKSSFKYSLTDETKQDYTDFNTIRNELTRQTNINNTKHADNYDVSNQFKLTRNFKKKDRVLKLLYNQAYSELSSDGILRTDNIFYSDNFPSTSINQKKPASAVNQNHSPSLIYTEPLSKKIKLELSYDYIYNLNRQDKATYDYVNGGYNSLDSLYTNNFKTTKQTNRAGLKFIYEVKKYRFSLGSRVRNVAIHNENIFKHTLINQNVNNVLPFASFRYRFSDNKSVDVGYYTSSDQPTITQLQPVPDNTNPNFVNVGNPNLLPTFQQHLEINFNSFKPVSGKYSWMGLYASQTDNAFSNSTHYDSIGRTLSQAVNVNGNMSAMLYLGTSWPLFSKKIHLNPNIDVNYNRFKSYINDQANVTQTRSVNTILELVYEVDKLLVAISGDYIYNNPTSTINAQSNRPYATQEYHARINAKLPAKLGLETEATYKINNQLNQGYNINYLVWNASVNKTFFKRENLILSLHAYDLLNQNINVNRNVQSNVITDTKTNIISRYFLLRLTYKFSSNKTQVAEDGDDE